MMADFMESLTGSLHTGFIDRLSKSSDAYKPRLVVNHPEKNENVLETILEELEDSKSFIFSVAFITESGLATLKAHLLNLKDKGINGRILTSTYLSFNQPKVFKELLKITNVEVRLSDIKGFHSKGYIFEHEDYYSLLVGSSNLTASALKVNHEWNIKLTSHQDGELIYHFKNQFEEIWDKSRSLDEAWIADYESRYVPITHNQLVDQVIDFPTTYETNPIEIAYEIKPNKMQEAALISISNIREAGNEKGLVISATGTGKTFLSAFDVRQYAPKRMLFIVHREQILIKARDEYKKILGAPDSEFGILSGSNKQTDAKYLFATIQSLSNDKTLREFAVDDFDYILIDEVHKAGAASYLKVMDYFKPDFMLGMTATPERTDDFNIFGLFDYNIAYEIRLQEALEEDMLCPFHYFGVTDFEHDGEVIDDATVLSKLVTEERVDHIIEKLNYYGYSGERVRGLMFCSRKEEAHKLSVALNDKGLRTVALTGDDDQAKREHYIDELERGFLDYILTVDIFNEGIDIPSINQVVMLRQTQSSIIFIQQLGRGLRKDNSKSFVAVIDFIGNYKNNYLIPVALSGDKTQNKDNIRRNTKDTNYIKGISTINFEEVARKRVFDSINNNNLTTLKILREAFVTLKNKIGHTPSLYDFILHNSIDPLVLVDRYQNYYEFLLKMKEEIPTITVYENKVLSMLSLEIANGKRMHEVVLLDLLIQNQSVSKEEYIQALHEADCYVDENTLDSVRRIFNLSFFTVTDRRKYGEEAIVVYDDKKQRYYLNESIVTSIKHNPFYEQLFMDTLHCAQSKAEGNNNREKLTLYNKYSRKDVCRLLNWHTDEKGTIFGYQTKYNTTPIFITYHKGEVESSVDYQDEFLNQEVLRWYTRSNRTLASKEVKQIIHAEERDNDIHIFVKKNDDEGTDFYYLGQALPQVGNVGQDVMKNDKGKEIPVVHMNLLLETPVEHLTYKYLEVGS